MRGLSGAAEEVVEPSSLPSPGANDGIGVEDAGGRPVSRGERRGRGGVVSSSSSDVGAQRANPSASLAWGAKGNG